MPPATAPETLTVQGSGKGTLSARLNQRFGIPIIDAGDELRWQISAHTDVGQQAKQVIHEGRLMPDEIMMRLVGDKMLRMTGQDWILDGFPRTFGQARLLHDALHDLDTPLTLVVNLQVPEEAILQRILERWTHVPSGRVYNLSFNPPKREGLDDVTGEPLEKRDDDNPETFKKRIDNFHRVTEPMINLLREAPCPLHPDSPLLVDIGGETSDIIWPKLLDVIQQRFRHLQGVKS